MTVGSVVTDCGGVVNVEVVTTMFEEFEEVGEEDPVETGVGIIMVRSPQGAR